MRSLTNDENHFEKTIEQLQDLKMKNQLMQKSNEDIENKLQEKKKVDRLNLETNIDTLLKKANEARPKMSSESQDEYQKIHTQFHQVKE